MTLPPQRWLKVVFFVTAAVFASVALYLYALRFFVWAEPDAAVPVELAAKVLAAKRPIVGDWYYANGDVWFLGPQLVGLLPVALLGIGPASWLITVAGGFVLQLIGLVRVYARLCEERWIALFAAMMTLMAWSQNHVKFVYIQLAYGFNTVLYVVLFGLAARLAVRASTRPWSWLGAGAMLCAISIQNPVRGLVYTLAPLLATCAWPWRGLAWRRRLGVAAALVAGWVVAYAIYTQVLPQVVAFSLPHGHIDFTFTGLDGMASNLVRLARGLVLQSAGGGDLLWAVPGLLVVLGALALVVTEGLASRALTPLRFLCLAAMAQLVMVCVPLIVGHLLVSIDSARYVMPSALTIVGLATILAVRAITTAGAGWLRGLATGWLAVVPVAALVAVPDARPPAPVRYVWPDLPELDRVADELVHRKLTHGFTNVLAAGVLNVASRGQTLACPIYFRDRLMPLRWLADTACYAAAAIPAQFYVVSYQVDQDDVRSLAATLPPPVDRFQVGPTYDVAVFRTADAAMQWLALPIPDGPDARFPIDVAATHLQMRRGEAVVEGTAVVATGAPGMVIEGPGIALTRGRYELVWIGRGLDTPGELMCSVRTRGGGIVLAHASVRAADLAKELPRDPGELCRLELVLNRTRPGLDARIETTGGARVALERLVIRRK
jgi:hypothetical protein